MIRSLAALFLMTGLANAQDATWPPLLIDPAGQQPDMAADLLLPMPCGGAMAFQRVDVPVDVERPLSDRPFRMGQSDASTAFADYLKPTHLRGAFNDAEQGISYYYIARYELNEGQYRAIKGDCTPAFKPIESRAKGGLSWFEAVDLARLYTEWLMENARDALPAEGDRLGFLRLPTEPEWEYAARGGATADPSVFAARRFFTEGSLADYAAHLAPGQGSSGLTVMAARRKPNPLGLFDIYGNAEELMLEPFRLNAVGRSHGQPGGLVTRGGSADLEEAQIYTAQRSEYPMFSSFTGKALAGEFFGARFVISAIVVSEDRFSQIKEDWIAEADRPVDASADPLTTLSGLLEDEVDPRRRDALSGLQLEFRVARDAADASLVEAAKSTLLSGAAFVETLTSDTLDIRGLERTTKSLIDRINISPSAQREQLMQNLRLNVEQLNSLREDRKTFLLSYRATLETLASDIEDATRDDAYKRLTQDLEAQGQTQLLNVLNRFWDDLAAYRETPDMDADTLLQTAIN